MPFHNILCANCVQIKKGLQSKNSETLYFTSAPVGIRTPNLLIRSQMLYPIELRVQMLQKHFIVVQK